MRSSFSRRVILALVIIAIAAGIVPALRYYRDFMSHVSTDDAYVDGTVALVSSRLSGTVSAVYVEDNWQVKEGDLLVTLDPRTFQVRVDQARAQLARARQTVDELYAQLAAARAGLELTESQLNQAVLDYNREASLYKANVVSKETYDQAVTAYRVAKANVALAQHQVTQAQAALGGDSEDHARYDRPIVQQAAAALEAARLDLSYTRITAPMSGIVTHKTVHVGHRVQPGEPLMAIVPTSRLYITANFKETQLTDVRVGQAADITADIYPGYVYKGHVDSISMGTGAAFALLPPENATGNWVKVVQRVPVKIVLNQPPPPDKPLRIGLSVEVSVDISDTRGPLLTSTLQKHFFRNGKPFTPPERLQIPPLPEILPGSPDIGPLPGGQSTPPSAPMKQS
jgi:membrane fusion protein (multidrug efflux system)